MAAGVRRVASEFKVLTTTMKAWQIDSFTGHNSLALKTVDIPTIRCPNDVLVQVKAASVNPLDLMMAKGYGHKAFEAYRAAVDDGPCPPLTLGRDFSGVIVDGGMESSFKSGDEVWGTVFPPSQGSHAEFVVASQTSLSLKPNSLDHVNAAAIPYAGLTAWSALSTTGGLGPVTAHGTNVLVLGASGGVGTLAIQLLKNWNCQVVATCKDDAFEMVSDLGADVVLDYKSTEFQSQMDRLKGKFDLIFDCAGSQDTQSFAKYLKPWSGSQYITLSSPLLPSTDRNGIIFGAIDTFRQLLSENFGMGSIGGHLVKWGYFMPNSSALRSMAKYVDQKKLKPVIQHVYKSDDLATAFDALAMGSARGKIVVGFGN